MPRSRPLDWIRPGALTAGIATLLAVWWKGLEKLGFLASWPDGFDGTFVATILVSVAIGAMLGHREQRPLVVRVLAAFAVACAFGALLIGLAFVMARGLHLAERNFTPIYVVLAGALIAWGVRRVPAATGARAALIAVAALLLLVRLLPLFPTAAHALEQRLFPLSPAQVRAEWDKLQCGSVCQDGRTKVLAFSQQISYGSESYSDYLAAQGRVHATLETVRAFHVDGCGQARDQPAEIPASVREFATVAACIAARPGHGAYWTSDSYGFDSACCALEGRQRAAGERFESHRTLAFSFVRRQWLPRPEEHERTPQERTPRERRRHDP
jgi:hypothetical protein